MEEHPSPAIVDEVKVFESLDPKTSIENVRELLSSKDDTSRFAGLAVLKSVLDNQPLLRSDSSQVTILWQAISPKFLDRLLRAGHNQKVTKEKAAYMVEIAASVVHKFSILLPNEVRDTPGVLGRLPALVNAIIESSSETTLLLLQTIVTLVSQPKGAIEFINIEDISPLTEIASQNSMVLECFNLAWSSASTEFSEIPKVRDQINQTVPMLISNFTRTDAVTLVSFIGDTLPKLPSEVLSRNPDWLQPLVSILQKLVKSRPTYEGRSAYTHMAAALMKSYPLECPPLIFGNGKGLTHDDKPFSYLFISLILIDLRSSFPSLLSKLNTPEYSLISGHLSSALDILLFFIGFLIGSLLDEAASNPFNPSMAPDLLLKLRKSIAETMSLTIEYLRERWDASVAGAAGLHPSLRHGTTTTSQGTRLTLTWDSMNENVNNDILIHASIRTLATYLREDENENLHKESAGLIDMFVELYRASTSGTLDFRQAILSALEVVLTTEEGIEGFLNQNGWEIFSQDLISIIGNSTAGETLTTDQDLNRGLGNIRILLSVIDSESLTEPRESWMELVKITASMKPKTSKDSFLGMLFQIALLQLAAALLTSSPKGVQRRYTTYITSMVGLATRLREEALTLRGQNEEEALEDLDDVIMSLENLR